MTVSELITVLSQEPPDAVVVVQDMTDEAFVVSGVKRVLEGTVTLVTVDESL